MKVTVEECPELEQTEVSVRCPRLDAQTARLIAVSYTHLTLPTTSRV